MTPSKVRGTSGWRVVAVAATLSSCAPLLGCSTLKDAWQDLRRSEHYPLDQVDRSLEPKSTTLPCHPEDMELYRGTLVSMPPITVHPALTERLKRFEAVAARVGTEIYGRPPNRIRHYGGYVCRSSRNRPDRLSEHALGNAIDVFGFDFPALSEKDESLPDPLQGPFGVRIITDWESEGGAAADLHQRFLRQLSDRVVRESVFRVALGPSHRGHSDHLHFDMAPYRYSDL